MPDQLDFRTTREGIVTTVHYHISSARLRPRRQPLIMSGSLILRIEAMHHVLNVSLNRGRPARFCTAAGVVGAIRRLAYAVIADLRGALSF